MSDIEKEIESVLCEIKSLNAEIDEKKKIGEWGDEREDTHMSIDELLAWTNVHSKIAYMHSLEKLTPFIEMKKGEMSTDTLKESLITSLIHERDAGFYRKTPITVFVRGFLSCFFEKLDEKTKKIMIEQDRLSEKYYSDVAKLIETL